MIWGLLKAQGDNKEPNVDANERQCPTSRAIDKRVLDENLFSASEAQTVDGILWLRLRDGSGYVCSPNIFDKAEVTGSNEASPRISKASVNAAQSYSEQAAFLLWTPSATGFLHAASKCCSIFDDEAVNATSPRSILSSRSVYFEATPTYALRAALVQCCGLNPEDFAPEFDVVYSQEGRATRGCERYMLPPRGSHKLALQVCGRYEDDEWLSKDGWPVVYHGTSAVEDIVSSIFHDGFKVRGGQLRARHGERFGEGIYCSPSYALALKYADELLEVNGVMYSLLFQCRVRPKEYDKVNNKGVWLVRDPSDIRPCAIVLIRSVLDDDDVQLSYQPYNPCSRDRHPNKWRHYETYKLAKTVGEAKGLGRSIRGLHKDWTTGKLTLHSAVPINCHFDCQFVEDCQSAFSASPPDGRRVRQSPIQHTCPGCSSQVIEARNDCPLESLASSSRISGIGSEEMLNPSNSCAPTVQPSCATAVEASDSYAPTDKPSCATAVEAPGSILQSVKTSAWEAMNMVQEAMTSITSRGNPQIRHEVVQTDKGSLDATPRNTETVLIRL